MARTLISDEARRRLQAHDPKWRSKAILRTVATFFDFLAMVLFIVSVTGTIHWENVWNDGFGGDWTDGMPLAPVLISIIYNPLVLFLLLRHRSGRAYHPGWDLAFDLLIWALAVPSIVFSVGDGWYWYWRPVHLKINNRIPCNFFLNFWSETCQPSIYTLGKIEMAANVFLGLILIIHFTLFVMACIATHKWRQAAKREKSERRNIELQYHRSPEEHTAEQPPAYHAGDVDKTVEAGGIGHGNKDIEANNGAALRYS